MLAFTHVFVFVFVFILLLILICALIPRTHTHSWAMCAKVAAALFDARIVVLPFDFCRQFTHILFISILLLFPRLPSTPPFLCCSCCCCLEARICFVAKWHRALGKCVKIQSVAGALEAWKGTAWHRGQACVCVCMCAWTLSKYRLICSYLFLSLAIAYARHVSETPL